MKKIREFIKRIKELWRIAGEYQGRYSDLYEKMNAVHRRLGEHTVIHADIHPGQKHFPGQVIVIGKYRRRDYVRVFNVENESIHELVDLLKRMERHAHVGRIDMPHGIQFSAVYDRETFE